MIAILADCNRKCGENHLPRQGPNRRGMALSRRIAGNADSKSAPSLPPTSTTCEEPITLIEFN
jgi:hypothetical protein